MKIGIRAWIDFAFRKIFGKPGNEICLISLLNAVLQLPHPVVSIEIHTVEIAKYNGESGEVRGASVLEQWAYWIKNAGEHTIEELRELLPALEFLRATGELNAIREITEEKQMYDAREKASLDIQSNLMDAKQEGRQEGIEIGEQRDEQRGKVTGSVQAYEGLLGGPISPDEALSKKSIEDLAAMMTQLQKRLRDRTS